MPNIPKDQHWTQYTMDPTHVPVIPTEEEAKALVKSYHDAYQAIDRTKREPCNVEVETLGEVTDNGITELDWQRAIENVEARLQNYPLDTYAHDEYTAYINGERTVELYKKMILP